MPKIRPRHTEARDLYVRDHRVPSQISPATRYREIVEAASEVENVLYGVWTFDRLIKIGFTTQLWRRMGAYGINHRTAERILFVTPGSRPEEQALHTLLSPHLARGWEYYHPNAEVLALVNEMRARYGVSPVTA